MGVGPFPHSCWEREVAILPPTRRCFEMITGENYDASPTELCLTSYTFSAAVFGGF